VAQGDSRGQSCASDPSGNSWLSSLWHKIQGGVKKLAHKAIDGGEELVTHPLRFIKNLPKHLVEGGEDAESAVAHNYEDAGHTISENFKDAEHWASEHAKEIEIAVTIIVPFSVPTMSSASTPKNETSISARGCRNSSTLLNLVENLGYVTLAVDATGILENQQW
jgi:hypothetical protein